VVYRVHPLTYLVGRRVVTVSHLSLINVMAGEEVVPEFLQDRFRPEAVAQTALELLDNVARREMMRRRVTELVATLGGPGASTRAAEAILLEAALAQAK
jgi:lipid-A-disaccharide synthase